MDLNHIAEIRRVARLANDLADILAGTGGRYNGAADHAYIAVLDAVSFAFSELGDAAHVAKTDALAELRLSAYGEPLNSEGDLVTDDDEYEDRVYLPLVALQVQP